jgi:hypothetical protein
MFFKGNRAIPNQRRIETPARARRELERHDVD